MKVDANLDEPASAAARGAPPRAKTGVDYPTHPLWQIVLSRVREFYREPETIFWVYGFPVLMALALGVAFREQPVETVLVAIAEGPQAATVREALEAASVDVAAPTASARKSTGDAAMRKSPESQGASASVRKIRFAVSVLPLDEARRKLRVGKTSLLVIASRNREQTPDETQTAAPSDARPLAGVALEYHHDPIRPEGVLARQAVDDALQRAAGRGDVVASVDHIFSEPGSRYIDFLIPGLIGAGLMGGGMWGVGFVVVDMRVRNLLKRFITTPMKKTHFLCGLILSRFFFQVTEIIVMLFFAWLAFGVPMEGSWATFFVFVALGGWTFCGIGLLVSTRARTLESASGWMNLVMLPMYIVSGIFFSYEKFPATAQAFIRLLPLTSLINALRAIMLEGAGLAALGLEAVILAAWTAITFWLALKLFRWS